MDHLQKFSQRNWQQQLKIECGGGHTLLKIFIWGQMNAMNQHAVMILINSSFRYCYIILPSLLAVMGFGRSNPRLTGGWTDILSSSVEPVFL